MHINDTSQIINAQLMLTRIQVRTWIQQMVKQTKSLDKTGC